ncbi:MAG TPA: glycosyltransferase, partial [Flavobacterium sp.]|nr:glycosyltransferase [Flavobacterium sp.]
EAMSLGLAVVSTNVGGIPFLLEDQKEAILIPDSDVEKMVEAIDRLIGDSELVFKITTNARRKAEQFDWNVVKKEWMTILK